MRAKIYKTEIRNLYTDGKSVGDLAKLFPQVSSTTMYRWAKDENWDAARESKIQKYTKSPEILLDALERMITGFDKQLTDPNQVAKTADAISKIVKSIKSLSKEKDRFSSIIFTLGELGKYMSQFENKHLFDEDFRGKFDKLLSGFQNLMLEKYSPNNMN